MNRAARSHARLQGLREIRSHISSLISSIQSETLQDLATALAFFFPAYPNELCEVRARALDVRDGIIRLDAFIQSITSVVCSMCKTVCCINRHSSYDLNDLIYVCALGLAPARYRSDLDDTEPCRFLSSTGCVKERSMRPFRCSWYFCDALLASMNNGPAKPFRQFTSRFQAVIDMRKLMVDEFFRVVQSVYGGENPFTSRYTNIVKS